MDKYEIFYNNLRIIYEKYKILQSYNSDFNIFKTIAKPADEVNLHSAFIYSLLNDKKYKLEFFKSFLKTINMDYDEINTLCVEKEKSTEYGRIDIFIDYSEKNIIVIENKIYAGDQEKQLDRYEKYCKKFSGKPKYKIIYLTLDGHEPSTDSCSNKDNLICISYKNEIINWIENCIKITALEPKLREVLLQYKELLIELSEGSNDYTMEVKDYILESADNFFIAEETKKAFEEIKFDLRLRYWKKLEEKLKDILKEFNLNVEDIKRDKLGSPNQWYSVKNASNDYGLIYLIREIPNIGKIYLKIAKDGDELIFGIRKGITEENEENIYDSNGKSSFKSKLKEFFGNKLKGGSSWLFYERLQLKSKPINPKNWSRELVETLYDENKLESLISQHVEEISKLIKLIVEFKE
ncbi:PDDEXK-like family protein [Peptoniphilus mikwangii]|uniref:PDDEXK-like family protein n=1 Tax=Peptoniphilus mikwangii TaxID=1354300 RepID=UPI00040DDF75|nr:PD-(D/E)XK nuclease family protein [Peptoniphilus mikwangii]